jgi:hypothetical protein
MFEYIKNRKIQLFVLLFAFQALFILFRGLLIGNNTATNIFELIIATAPDFFICLIFSIALIKFIKDDFKSEKIVLFDVLILIYFVSNILLGIILANNILYSFYAIRLTYLPMLMYFSIRFYANSFGNSDYKSILDGIFNWYTLFAFIFLILYLFFPEIDTASVRFVGGKVNYYIIRRMGGIFFSPVGWGTFMAAGAIYYFIKFNSKFSIYTLLVFCLFWFCLILSVSRGAIISFYFGSLMVCYFTKQYKPFLKALLFTSAIFFTYGFFNPPTLSLIGFVSSSSIETMNGTGEENHEIILSEADGNLVKGIQNTRVKFWKLSLRDFTRKPMGYGLGKAGHIGNRFFSSPTQRKNAAIYSTDGWYLKLANETGIWGLVTYLVIFIFHLYFILKNSILFKNELFLFSFVLFVMIAIQNVMSNVLDFYSFACFYWLVVALVYNLKQNIENEVGI